MSKSRSVLKVLKVVETYKNDRRKKIYCYIAEACCMSDDAEGTLTNALKAAFVKIDV